jgi:hypothetical protein
MLLHQSKEWLAAVAHVLPHDGVLSQTAFESSGTRENQEAEPAAVEAVVGRMGPAAAAAAGPAFE